MTAPATKKRRGKQAPAAVAGGQLLRSAPACLHDSITFDTCLEQILLFLDHEEIGRVCFLACGARGGEAEAAYRCICLVATRPHRRFLHLASDYPGGWQKQYEEQVDADSAGFWRQRQAALNAAKAATAAKYPDIAKRSRPQTAQLLRDTRSEEENAAMEQELFEACLLPLKEQRRPACLARIRELLARGTVCVFPGLAQREMPMYACGSADVAEMLLAAGSNPDGEPGPWSTTVVDAMDAVGWGKGSKARLLRRHGALTQDEKEDLQEDALAAAHWNAQLQYEQTERKLRPALRRLAERFGYGTAHPPFGGSEVEALQHSIALRRATTARAAIREAAASVEEELACIDRELFLASHDAARTADVLDLLLRGADPDVSFGRHFWPRPLTQALGARGSNPSDILSLRSSSSVENALLLLFAGAHARTSHLEARADGAVVHATVQSLAMQADGCTPPAISTELYSPSACITQEWMERQRAPVFQHLVAMWGAKDCFFEREARAFDGGFNEFIRDRFRHPQLKEGIDYSDIPDDIFFEQSF